MQTINTANQKAIADLQRGVAQMKHLRVLAAGIGNRAEVEGFRTREVKLREQIRKLGGKA